MVRSGACLVVIGDAVEQAVDELASRGRMGGEFRRSDMAAEGRQGLERTWPQLRVFFGRRDDGVPCCREYSTDDAASAAQIQ